MKPYKNENSLIKHSNRNKLTSKNISLLNFKLIHRISDSINISLLILIFILTFISFDSQRKWTNIYKNLAKLRENNNNLIDYISKTEEFYIQETESLADFKKTTPKDLIYLVKQSSNQEKKHLKNKLKYIFKGLKDSAYQRGY